MNECSDGKHFAPFRRLDDENGCTQCADKVIADQVSGTKDRQDIYIYIYESSLQLAQTIPLGSCHRYLMKSWNKIDYSENGVNFKVG